jgi:predicted nucleic acid-binding protein
VQNATPDPKDDYLVALAVCADADVLCSGDADLQGLTEVTVLTPAQLLERVLATS